MITAAAIVPSATLLDAVMRMATFLPEPRFLMASRPGHYSRGRNIYFIAMGVPKTSVRD